MKFMCEGLVLSEAALTVSKACATKTLTPVLECIRLAVKNDTLTLTAYDGEISIEKQIPADVIEEGETCVNGRFFSDFIGKISNMYLTIASGERGLEIEYADCKSNMQVLPATDFPVIRKDLGDKCIEVKENDFKKLISDVVFCCATDDARPMLKGALLEAENGTLTATSLDGFRMATSYCACSQTEGKVKLVCPARTLNEISRMLEGNDEVLKLNFSTNTLSVCAYGTALISRLYLGEFVNKNNIFPTAFETDVFVARTELISSLERASILIRGDKNNLIIMDIKPNAIYLSANSEIGAVAESVKCELDGKEIKLAMNAKYMLEALKALDEEFVKISLNTPIAPFTVVNKEKNVASYLILPVRTTA